MVEPFSCQNARLNIMLPDCHAEIIRSIDGLNSLIDGEKSVLRLIGYGNAAVSLLRDYLIGGMPSGIYQPRRWAVQALGGIGAKEVLLEYLKQERHISDPVVRMGEEAVENEAARQLASWPTEDVLKTLMHIAQSRTLAGVLDALGRFGRPEATPYFVEALEDGLCRSVAEDALRKLGALAKPELIVAALSPWPDQSEEMPSSLSRRRTAAQLLTEIGVSFEEWRTVRALIEESDPGLLVCAGRLATVAGTEPDRAIVSRRLVGALESADWYLRMEMEEVLTALYEWAKEAIDDEITRRRERPAVIPADLVLPFLERVKGRALETQPQA